MWLYILGGILGAIALIEIAGAITVAVIKEEMQNMDIKGCCVDTIYRCDNKIKLSDLYSNKTFEMEGDSISDDLYEGEQIYV